MVVRRCMVHNCPGNYTALYKFPSDRKFENRLFIWLSACGNKELLRLPKKSLLQRGICNIHFEAKYFLQRGLSVSAVPSLHLPDPIEIPLDHYTHVECEGGKNDGSNSSRAMDEPSISEINNFTEGVQMYRNLKRSREENAGTIVSMAVSKPKIRRKEHSLCCTSMRQEMKEKNPFGNRSLLKVFKAASVIQLSKDNRRYYQAMVEMYKKIKQYKIQKQTYMKRLKIANNFMNHDFWSTIPEHIKNLFLCYKRNINIKRCKRSFTLNEKVLALSIWKKSPKNYRFFQDLLLLPSTTTLKKLITELNIKPGLCHSVFNAMEKKIKFFTPEEKICTIIFDKMQLSPGINYNATDDHVEGIYIDRQGKLQFSDHATVWMLKGVYGARPWKQTVAFTYGNCNNTHLDVTEMFQEIAIAAENIGLTIIACVCDQSTINVKAINTLIENSSNNKICINNREIIPLYDVPHLMKCIRNNLLTKNLQFSLDGKNSCIAKWEHIKGTYEIDRTNGSNRFLTKITEEHVQIGKIKKMKVSYCTQIFSATFAKIIYFYANYKPIQGDHNITLSPEPHHTADLLRFFNNLFDSLNNFYNESYNSKIYSRNLSIWNEAIKIIASMKYIKNKPKDRRYPVVLKSWIFTLKNIIELNYKLKVLEINFAGRNFNQDPLKNFFSIVRSHGGRNANPTCTSFSHYYKSIFINNFGRGTSYKGNCENDRSDYFIQTKNLIDMRRREVAEVSESFNDINIRLNSVNDTNISNILAAVAKTLKSDCQNCRQFYKVTEIQKMFNCSLFIDICHSIIIDNICDRNLSKKAMAYFDKNIFFETSHTEHSTQLKFNLFNKIFHHVLNIYIKRVNQALIGKVKNVKPSGEHLFDEAFNYYSRKNKRKRVPT